MTKEELKKYREDHSLSQSQLAEIVGVKVGTVQSWEQGKRNIGQSAIKLLQEYDLVKEENEKTPPGEVRFEDVITKKVFEEIAPLLNGNTEKLLKALANLHIEINKIKIAQMKTQESVKVIEERV